MANAWLLLTVEGDRQHGGNDGYQDEPDTFYSWDSTVANHARVKVGDAIAIWDKVRLMGASVVESIEIAEGKKFLHRCVECGMAGIKPRSTRRPRFKCYKCKAEFEQASSHVEAVTTYRSRHDAGWVDLNGALAGPESRALTESPKSQHSMRPLDWRGFEDAIGRERLIPVQRRWATDTHGHRTATTRVRRGQSAFRRKLLERLGPCCALSGPHPEYVLEAAHLYSYARLGVHAEHGGLLIRRDLHRLFDMGLVAVEPQTLRLDLDDELLRYQTYAGLQGVSVACELRPRHKQWLSLHWNQHHRPR